MLHAPDFLGFQDSIELARAHPGVVERALKLKKLGNHILELIGGRAVHPVNLKVGGFYRAPRKAEIRTLIEPLQWAIDASLETLKLFAGFEYPEYQFDYTSVSLRHVQEYPITEGRIVSSRGLDIGVDEFLNYVEEEHVERSNALHARLNGSDSYLLGPVARYNNNFDRLSPLVQQAAKDAGLEPVCRNPFQSLMIRAVEVLYACEEALRLAQNYEEPDTDSVEIIPHAGSGHGCTEAPRGICYHHYELDDEGRITHACIIPPTSQNQRQIERDLRGVVERYLHLPEDELTWRCEQTIRNYDPCISCATHFLQLTIERG
jgi:coenzyme F420-reducing hydrogenase alpha subunit